MGKNIVIFTMITGIITLAFNVVTGVIQLKKEKENYECAGKAAGKVIAESIVKNIINTEEYEEEKIKA